MTSKQKRLIAIIGAGIVLTTARFYPYLLHRQVLIFGDNYSLQVPGKIFSSTWLNQGIVPWWNPTILGGIPWAAEASQSLLYPSTLLFMMLHPGDALNLTVMLHLLFTFIGMYILSKRWVNSTYTAIIASILWTYSTQVTSSINNLVTIQSIAWFPWVLWAAKFVTKKAVGPLFFSMFVLGQFLAGYPQHLLYSLPAAAALSALIEWKNNSLTFWIKKWAYTAFLTAGLSAVVWLPFSEPFLNSTRMLQTSQQAGAGSLSPAMIIKAIVPYFFDNPHQGYKWGPAWTEYVNAVFYLTWVGILGIISIIYKKQSKFLLLLLLSGLTIFISFGEYLPGFSLLQTAFPLFRIARYPSMFLIITTIFLSILVSKGIETLDQKRIASKCLLSSGILLLFTLGAYIIVMQNFPELWNQINTLLRGKLSHSSFHTIERDQILARTISASLSFMSTSLLISLWAIKSKRPLLLVSIIALDMLVNTQAVLFFGPRDVYSKNSVAGTSQLLDPQYRTLSRNSNEPYTDFASYWEALTVRAPFSDSFVDAAELKSFNHLNHLRQNSTPDWNMVDNIQLLNGYTTLLPADFSKIWQQNTNPSINFIDHISIHNPLLAEWAVKNYIVDTKFNINEKLPGSPINLSAKTLLYQLPALSRFRYENGTSLDLKNFYEDPNRISFSFTNPNDTSIIIADRYDKNWRATINGTSSLILNHQGMRKIPIQKGNVTIELSYQPTLFYIGTGLTIATLLLALAVIKYSKPYEAVS